MMPRFGKPTRNLLSTRYHLPFFGIEYAIVQTFGPVSNLLGTQLAGSLNDLTGDRQWKDELIRVIDETVQQQQPQESTIGSLKIRSQLIRPQRAGREQSLVLTLFEPIVSIHSANRAANAIPVTPMLPGCLQEPAREKLRLDEMRLQAALEGSLVGVVEFDLENPDWVFADHLERLLGFERGELNNSSSLIRQRIHPDDRPAYDRATERVTQGENTSLEIRLRDKSGQYRWFSVDSQVLSNTEGQPTRVMATLSNIHELKQAQLKSSDEVRRRDELVAILSHELRNPMAAITFSLDCLNTLGELPEEFSHLLAIIERQTSHMTKLLQDLLDVSRLTRNRISYEMVKHDLNQSVSDVVQSVLPSIKSKQQTLTQQLSDQPLWVVGDVSRLKQVMINLLDNASKYTPEEGQISLETRELDGQVFFSITDSGYGLEESKQNNLFELFYQADNPSRSRSGIGVGLFLVDQIMRAHNGSVFAESGGPGQGSTFTISLLHSNQDDGAGQVSESSDDFGSDIMLVEDNVDSLSSLSSLLKQKGFRVIEFADGDAALHGLNSVEFSAAIIDVDLPGTNGLQLAKNPPARPPQISFAGGHDRLQSTRGSKRYYGGRI